MKGIVNVLKSPGMTSFDIVAICRRIFDMKKIGHAGTLDPGAAGVLALCLGRGTKIVPFLTETKKGYRAELQLGVETTTLDAFGEIVREVNDFTITKDEVESILKEFEGEIEQIPPMFSAIKYEGKPLYKLARQGKKVKRKPRKVRIYNLELISFKEDKLLLDIECSKGTYIRTLAADIGQRLGMGAYMSFLVRTKVGAFSLNEALTIEELEKLSKEDKIEQAIHPLDSGLKHLPSIQVKSDYDIPITNGVSIELKNLKKPLEHSPKIGDYFRVYNSNGNFVAIHSWAEEGIFKPKRVFV